MTDREIAREILKTLQAAVDAKDLDRMTGLFPADGVLVGTRLYNLGGAAVRDYLTEEVVAIKESLCWDLPRLDVFLRTDHAIGFSGEGRITVTSPDTGALHFPFRLTIVAEETGRGWLIRHFHGSLPSVN
jgi:ketosteroid isomerase-like protein